MDINLPLLGISVLSAIGGFFIRAMVYEYKIYIKEVK